MKQIAFFLLSLLTSLNILAYDFSAENSDGVTIYYNINSGGTSVTVTSGYRGSYSGRVEIPQSVEYNGKSYSVTLLDRHCFYECSSLISVEIPNSVTSLGIFCFNGCSSLTSVEIPNSVTSLGDYCFSQCSSLSSVEIPNSVTSLGVQCFRDCNSLTSIDIPNSVTALGRSCFSGCSSLTSVEIPNSVTSLDDYCFSGCSSLTSVEIPNSVTSLDDYCFYGCSSLISIEIPNSVTTLGSECFSRCSSLTSVEIPNSMTSLSNHCFNGCSSLTSVEIPNSVTSLGYCCFYGCSSLTSVEIPYSVTSLGNYCFYKCSSLTSVNIPNSVTTLGNYCFSGCKSLPSVEIPNSVTSLGDDCFYSCSSLTSVKIPNSVTSLGKLCFALCSSLTSVIIPNSVTSIGRHCFWQCSSLTSIAIPNSVTSLGEYCFYYCWSLTSFRICNNEPSNVSLGDNVFSDVISNPCILYVPTGSKELYAAADQWKEFRRIREFDYSLNISNSDLRRGRMNLVPVEMVNEDEVVSFQCDLSLPEGLSLGKNGDSYDIRKTDRTSELVFSASDVDGKIRILGFSPTNTPIIGNEGAIFTLPINVSQDMTLGDNVIISLSDIQIIKKEGFEEINTPSVASEHKVVRAFGLGDVNDDGRISVGDISMSVEYVMGRTPSNSIKEAADVNEDDKISAADLSIIVSYILSGNTSPSPRIAPKNNNISDADDEVTLSLNSNKLRVGVSNANAYTAAQFDVALPDGISLSGIEMPNAYTNHIATYSMLNGNIARVLIYSPTNEQFPFGESLINLSLSTSSANASEWIGVDNMLLAAKEGSDIVEYHAMGDNCYANISGVGDITANGKLTVKTKNGNIIITSDRDTTVTITTVSGQTQTETIHIGENLIPATPGIYFVNGKKIILN